MSVENSIPAVEIGSANTQELLYGGFWRRLAAYAVDFAILVPLGLLTTKLIYISRDAYLVALIVGTFIAILFHVYLVKRFGGTPGKMVLGLRITRPDGSPVGYKEASIRYSVLFIVSILLSVPLLTNLFAMSDADYVAFASAKPSLRSLEVDVPAWYQPLQYLGSIWVYSEFIVLLTNKKRRALHDFLAGTVVIRSAGLNARG
jgi:uncharacterized RDD family membrane protein YckC